MHCCTNTIYSGSVANVVVLTADPLNGVPFAFDLSKVASQFIGSGARAGMAKATTKSKTPAKKTARKGTKAPSKSAAKVRPVVVQDTPVVAGPTLRKKAFIDKIVEATGAKRKDAKPIVEAVLAELGTSLSDGADLQLPPLGKIKIHRRKDLANGEMLMLKLRRAKPQAPSGGDPLADAAE